MIKEIRKHLIPRKLWILRLYIAILTFIVEFLLGAYVLVSIYNLIASDNALGDIVLGYAGLYLVWICLAILFVVQVVSMFINIHDNIEDVRNKAVILDFAIDLEKEKEKGRDAKIRSIATIVVIVISIILSFVNLNRENTVSKFSQFESGLFDNHDIKDLESKRYQFNINEDGQVIGELILIPESANSINNAVFFVNYSFLEGYNRPMMSIIFEDGIEIYCNATCEGEYDWCLKSPEGNQPDLGSLKFSVGQDGFSASIDVQSNSYEYKKYLNSLKNVSLKIWSQE
jgi:hypothetical protein